MSKVNEDEGNEADDEGITNNTTDVNFESTGSASLITNPLKTSFTTSNLNCLNNTNGFTQKTSNFLSPLEQNRRASLSLLQNQFERRRTLHHRVKSWIAPSDTPTNAKIFGGRRAVQAEQIRSKNAGWIIHPYSSLRYYWDLIVMLILLLNMIMLPLNIAFFNSGQSWAAWITIHTISDIIFMADIVFNFRTGYKLEDTGSNLIFVLEPRMIAKRYARSWFVVDLVSSIPFDNVFLMITGGENDYGLGVKSAFRGFKFLRLVKLLSLLKLLRISRIVRYLSKYEDFYNMTATVMRYFKLVMMMLMVAHWNGCLGFLVPMLQEFPENSWVALNKLQNADWSEQYGWALFKALSHMLCIGYGRFIPMLLSEALITIFSMITGATFYALFIAHSMAYIQQRDSARRLYQEKFQQIEEYMRYRNLPQQTRERIAEYYEHKYYQKRLFNETEILSEISKPLRDDIVNHNCRDLIESVPFLREGGPDFITLITNSLTFDVFLPGDLIIKEGTLGDEMYFIRNGTVDVTVEEQHVTTLSEGDYFGEITMLTNARRVASVTAVNVCDLFILTRDNLYRVLDEFPDMRVVMEHVALNRLIKLKEKFPCSVNTCDATVDLSSRRETSGTASVTSSLFGNPSLSSISNICKNPTNHSNGTTNLQKTIFERNNQVGPDNTHFNCNGNIPTTHLGYQGNIPTFEVTEDMINGEDIDIDKNSHVVV